jgi:hypothetical protein
MLLRLMSSVSAIEAKVEIKVETETAAAEAVVAGVLVLTQVRYVKS